MGQDSTDKLKKSISIDEKSLYLDINVHNSWQCVKPSISIPLEIKANQEVSSCEPYHILNQLPFDESILVTFHLKVKGKKFLVNHSHL